MIICVVVITACILVWTWKVGPVVEALLEAKAAYWDACTREKDGKAGWNR